MMGRVSDLIRLFYIGRMCGILTVIVGAYLFCLLLMGEC